MDQSDSPELSADFASNHMALVGGLATELEADSGAGNGPHPPTGGRPSSSHPVTRRTLAQGGPAMTQWKAALRQADGIAPGGTRQGPRSHYVTQMLFTKNGFLSPLDVVDRTLVFGDGSSHAYASTLAQASLSILRRALQRLRLSDAASVSSDPAHHITLQKIAKVKARICSSLTQVAANNVMLEAGRQSSRTPASSKHVFSMKGLVALERKRPHHAAPSSSTAPHSAVPVVNPPRKRHKPQLLY